MTTVPPVPSPRPAEEIRADLARAADGSLDALANWPALNLRLIADVAPLLADRERLSAELADARAETGAVRVKYRAWVCDARLEERAEAKAQRKAAERVLEAVRALHFARGRNILGQPVCNECSPLQPMPCPTLRALDDAALSAASPTTSDDEQPLSDEPDVPPTHGLRRSSLAPVANRVASDEPARCPHGLTEYGTTNCPVEGVRAFVDDGECSACGAPVGPAASGTPETTA